MAKAPERAAEIASDGAHIGSLAADRLEDAGTAFMLDERKRLDPHGARLELDVFASPRQVIGSLAGDLDGGKTGRRLHDVADESRKRRLERWLRGTSDARSGHRPFTVVRVVFLALMTAKR